MKRANRISDRDAAAIHLALQAGCSPTDIARHFKVSRQSVYNIKHGKRNLDSDGLDGPSLSAHDPIDYLLPNEQRPAWQRDMEPPE